MPSVVGAEADLDALVIGGETVAPDAHPSGVRGVVLGLRVVGIAEGRAGGGGVGGEGRAGDGDTSGAAVALGADKGGRPVARTRWWNQCSTTPLAARRTASLSRVQVTEAVCPAARARAR
ncbi:hypothetical protein ABZ468_53285 [Streptomyces sp. NPDC005708]|uniref:hypothetical protein n=1 Tax=Streptomyces sp. NPDC005708 TaxID=3154564 RepID=UPI0033E30C01